uniref:Uncharacterized protein n=1 Tax=Parascaris equorum TaxID=6256 RepID=A0A914S382_PAREQ
MVSLISVIRLSMCAVYSFETISKWRFIHHKLCNNLRSVKLFPHNSTNQSVSEENQ